MFRFGRRYDWDFSDGEICSQVIHLEDSFISGMSSTLDAILGKRVMRKRDKFRFRKGQLVNNSNVPTLCQ